MVDVFPYSTTSTILWEFYSLNQTARIMRDCSFSHEFLTWAHTWSVPSQGCEGMTKDDTISLQQPCWNTTPPTIGAVPAHWKGRHIENQIAWVFWFTHNLHIWIFYIFFSWLHVQSDWWFQFCACASLENSLEANADKRPKLDVHLGVCRVVAHVDWLHCLGTADRGRSCTSYCLLHAKLLHRATFHHTKTTFKKHTRDFMSMK